MIERIFQEIQLKDIGESDNLSYLLSLGWSTGETWERLLQSSRILMMGEAGVGKTYECRNQAKQLKEAGEKAFFIELSALATNDLINNLDPEEEKQFKDWLDSQSEVATFFLDSIDELKLTASSFESAIKRFKRDIHGKLDQARIVITTRPTPFDLDVVKRILTKPRVSTVETNAENFAENLMNRGCENLYSRNTDQHWRIVTLMPLSDNQIKEFCRLQEISNPEQIIAHLEQHKAMEFARRPQDLIELCADWREYGSLRRHQDQICSNIKIKLRSRIDRQETADLEFEKALEGAKHLALASQLTRRLTIRNEFFSIKMRSLEDSVDPSLILLDWPLKKQQALLERPLFEFASYGRVRFHHRSVMEYLAACYLRDMLNKGMSFKVLKRILFIEVEGKTYVYPSKRAISGWLSIFNRRVYELLRDNAPEVLLEEGDPESLTLVQRKEALRAFAGRYGSGGWRGLNTTELKLSRFATKDMGEEVIDIWEQKVENPEIREFLIRLVEVGRIDYCADFVFNIAIDSKMPNIERILAIKALIAIEDVRLRGIVSEMVSGGGSWTEKIICNVSLWLFPKYMSVSQLCSIIKLVSPCKHDSEYFKNELPNLINNSSLDLIQLEELREQFLLLVENHMKVKNEAGKKTCPYLYVKGGLVATCCLGLNKSLDYKWLYASAVALKCNGDDYNIKKLEQDLIKKITSLNEEATSRLFWIVDEVNQRFEFTENAYRRFVNIISLSNIVSLNLEKDFEWLHRQLAEKSRNIEDRALLLETLLYLVRDPNFSDEKLETVKRDIEDSPDLMAKLETYLKTSKETKGLDLIRESKKNSEIRRERERSHWIRVWNSISGDSGIRLSEEKYKNIAFQLWHAISSQNGNIRNEGRLRHFFEKHFGKEKLNEFKPILMKVWRELSPTLPSQREVDERNSYPISWQFGLAAIYSEAEEQDWSTKLTEAETCLACKYVPLELNGFPEWVASLARQHPRAIDSVLGNELSWELKQPNRVTQSVLDGLGSATKEIVTLFLPRLISWVKSISFCEKSKLEDSQELVRKINKVASLILDYGDSNDRDKLQSKAVDALHASNDLSVYSAWLSVLMNMDQDKAIRYLQERIELVIPSQYSDAVSIFGNVFARDQNTLYVNLKKFTPKQLLSLVCLSYDHIKIQDDVYREGAYFPDVRDNAEEGRDRLFNALMDTNGIDGYRVKLELANMPLFSHIKDRIIYLAESSRVSEADQNVMTCQQFVDFEKSWIVPAITNHDMFQTSRDKLFEIEEILLSDLSPRETWAKLSEVGNEKLMRREIARTLDNISNSVYVVSQEEVTAEEKETDIRLCSRTSNCETVFELKIGNDRSAQDLCETIEKQLYAKYMAPMNRKSGILLIVVSKDRNWEHPDDNKRINLEGLKLLLKREAERVQHKFGDIYLDVHILDLRPRLLTEKKSKLSKNKLSNHTN